MEGEAIIHAKNVFLTCRKESESCFVCLGCESSYYSMHGLHYHLNRTRYTKNKQGGVGKSPPKSCEKIYDLFQTFFTLNGINIFKVRIRWTRKNSKQKKLQRSLCEVREKICTVNPESREMATKILLLDTLATSSCVLVLDVATQLVTWQECTGNTNLLKRRIKKCFL